jgi:hypothetical protein
MTEIGTVRVVGTTLFYAYIFWHIFKSHPENRVIRCGSITLIVFIVMLALTKVPNFPFWYLGPLLFSLCMLTMVFLLQQGYRALHNRKKA